MRRIARERLDPASDSFLNRRQTEADTARLAGTLMVASAWKAARAAKGMQGVVTALRRMCGSRERCMYCCDSHGTDIEHFWPKQVYPEHMFRWLNLLLCCAECGRLKGDRFPMEGSEPLLVDPTAHDPWEFLDFDPTMGLLIPRYDRSSSSWSATGSATVQLLQLDEREALNEGYRKTYLRLRRAVDQAIATASVDGPGLLEELEDLDDHGLLAWCFSDRGLHEQTFSQLHARFPEAWRHCADAVNAT